jgi:DNA-directed RNA polymerase specialized sigma54-like protein
MPKRGRETTTQVEGSFDFGRSVPALVRSSVQPSARCCQVHDQSPLSANLLVRLALPRPKSNIEQLIGSTNSYEPRPDVTEKHATGPWRIRLHIDGLSTIQIDHACAGAYELVENRGISRIGALDIPK